MHLHTANIIETAHVHYSTINYVQLKKHASHRLIHVLHTFSRHRSLRLNIRQDNIPRVQLPQPGARQVRVEARALHRGGRIRNSDIAVFHKVARRIELVRDVLSVITKKACSIRS